MGFSDLTITMFSLSNIRNIIFTILTILSVIINNDKNVVAAAEKKIEFFQLQKGDLSVNITNYGATVLNVILPDKNGTFSYRFSCYMG